MSNIKQPKEPGDVLDAYHLTWEEEHVPKYLDFIMFTSGATTAVHEIQLNSGGKVYMISEEVYKKVKDSLASLNSR